MLSKSDCDNKSRRCHIVVIGGGYVGITTAWLLAQRQDGKKYKVTVLERNEKISREMSYLNGGLLCPGLTLPWSNIQTFKCLVKYTIKGVFNRDLSSPIYISPGAMCQRRFWSWGFSFMHNLLPTKVASNYAASYRLAKYSLNSMDSYQPVSPSEYGRWAIGSLQTCTSLSTLSKCYSVIFNGIGPLGCPVECLNCRQVYMKEPVLQSLQRPIVGAVHTSDDSSGQYINKTNRNTINTKNVVIRTNVNVASFEFNNNKIKTIITSDGERIDCDVVVNAAGNGAEMLAAKVGDRLMTYPICGYVLEAKHNQNMSFLKYSIIDDLRKIYICPLVSCDNSTNISLYENLMKYSTNVRANTNSRIRISGFCDFFPTSNEMLNADELVAIKRKRCLSLLKMAEEFLPLKYLEYRLNENDKIDDHRHIYEGLVFNVCFRSNTPDDLPVIGQSPSISNLWYNAGHGHIGWTRGFGSSLILVDLIEGKTPEIDPVPYSPRRWKSWLFA